MLKLFVAVIAMSDTGSISTTWIATDYNDPVACTATARSIQDKGNFTRELAGHTVTISTEAHCRQAVTQPAGQQPRYPSYNGPPPMQGDFFNGYLQSWGFGK